MIAASALIVATVITDVGGCTVQVWDVWDPIQTPLSRFPAVDSPFECDQDHHI